MNGMERRKLVLDIISNSGKPVSGSSLAEQVGVSRQVIVQDIALLRAANVDVISTSRGYRVINENKDEYARRYCVSHNDDQIEEELYIFVDHGAEVLDVIVEHPVYGEIRGPLGLQNRRDARIFLEKIKANRGAPLLNMSNGIHYHTAKADSEAVLDEVEKALDEAGFLYKGGECQ